MQNYDIIITNSLTRLSTEELKNNKEIMIKAPDDEALITVDTWGNIIAFLLKHDCYSYTTYGVHSEKLHDLIDDLAFDIFPLIKNKDLSWENDYEEINKYLDLLSSKLITVWECDVDSESFDDTLVYIDCIATIDSNTIIFKDVEFTLDYELFIKYKNTNLNKIKQSLL